MILLCTIQFSVDFTVLIFILNIVIEKHTVKLYYKLYVILTQ